MKSRIAMTVVCALVIGAAGVVACGGPPPGPTTPSDADGGTSSNGSATNRVPREGPTHEH